MRKYLVNYRVLSIRSTTPIPYLEYTDIYETKGMMTQEDVEAFEGAKTNEYGGTATMVSFYELKYSTPTLEDYIVALPYFTFKNGKLETTDNDWAYIPTLYKFEGAWAIDWMDAKENDTIIVIKGATPFEAAKNAYDWCVEKGYIKDTLNNR